MGAKKYSPSDKAAIIVAALGEDLAPSVFAQLGVEDSAKIGRSLRSLGAVELKEIDEVLTEFLAILQSPKARGLDVQSFLKGLGTRGGAKGQALLDSIGTGEYTMRVFDRTRPEILYRIIANETPQTLALILSHAPSPFAAGLVRLFPEALRIEILLRISRLREVDPELVQDIDDQLVREVDKLGSTGSQKIGGIKKVAEILNALNQEAPAILDHIANKQPDLAADIQQEMFTFEDLLKINDKGITEIVKIFKREVLILALRGAPVEMIQKFAAGMSERSAKMFREDLEALGAQKKSDVMKARTDLLAQTRALIDAGKIEFGAAAGAYV